MEIHLNDFKPSKVLKVYSSASKHYIEIHNVYPDKDKYKLGAGSPLTKNVMKKLMSSCMDVTETQSNDIKMFDSSILYCVPEKYKRVIVWWRPAKAINMSFTNILKDGEIWMPPMLFIVQHDNLSIFAMKENRRPTLHTKLYNAPLLNNVTDNKMCWGSVNISIDASADVNTEVQAWENKLWFSRFAHAGSLKSTNTDIIKLYKSLLNTRKKFPIKELVYSGKTYVNSF